MSDPNLAGSALTDPDNPFSGQEVTMRGDLEQIDLSDIFQTLSMSKMEGILRVCNPLETHDLFFRNGYVQSVVTNRQETRRLGQRLLQCGLVEPADLRAALQEQKETGRPLGPLLVEQGILEQQQIDDVICYYQAESIYGLFLWTQGEFEFYKGPPQDAEVRDRFSIVPTHECNAVLLEVARRADEWKLILDKIGSVDEVYAPRLDSDAEALGDDHALVFASLDGSRSIRELADYTQLALFDCARAARDLLDQDMILIAGPEAMLQAAEAQRERNDTKRAVVTLRTLLERGADLTEHMLRDLAVLLERCGEGRMAGQCLLQRARRAEDDADRIELARQAAKLDTRSDNVLEFLQEELLNFPDEMFDELLEVSHQLADLYESDSRSETAIECLLKLTDDAAEDIGTTSRLARLYTKLGDSDATISQWERVADYYAATNKRQRLATVYEQILKLDETRKDIAKALRLTRVSKAARRARLAGIAAAVAVSLIASGLVLHSHHTASQLESTVEQIRAKLDGDEVHVAASMLATARSDFGEQPIFESLAASVARAQARVDEKRRKDQVEAQRQRLAAAANFFDRAELRAALDIYAELWGSRATNADIEKAVKNRVGSLGPALETTLRNLPRVLPDRPNALQSPAEQTSILTQLRADFLPAKLALADAVLEVQDHELVKTLMSTREHEQMLEAMSKLRELFRDANERIHEYENAQERSANEQRLQPLFVTAREHEARHEFAQALAAYRKLSAEYRVDNGLRQHFIEQTRRYEAIQRDLQAIREATARGDFDAARELLEALDEREPEIEFATLAELPLTIETTPAGATVAVNGKPIGRAPIRTSFSPGHETVVTIQLRGFETVQRRLRGYAMGRIAVQLGKAADWRWIANGVIASPPAFDARGRAYVVDRSGTIQAVEMQSGEVFWSRETKDLSGLLPSPLVVESRVYVASVDGKLRSLSSADGAIVWETPDLPSETAPVMHGDNIVVITTEGECVGVRPESGEEVFRVQLPGPVRSSATIQDTNLIAVTTNGHVASVSQSGKLRWNRRIGARIAASAAVTPTAILATTDDGDLYCLAADDGEVQWRRADLGEITLAPVVRGDAVIVASLRHVRSFKIAAGTTIADYGLTAIASGAPVIAGDRVFVGTRAGTFEVLDAATLKFRYVIRGPSAASAPVAIDGDGRLLAAFGRTSLGFLSVP